MLNIIFGNKGRTQLATTIFWILIVVVVYVIVKIVPVYIHDYQVQNIFEQEINTIPKQSVAEVQFEILRKFKEMESPIEMSQVKIERNDGTVTISALYSTTVKFIGGYKKVFTFNPIVTKVIK